MNLVARKIGALKSSMFTGPMLERIFGVDPAFNRKLDLMLNIVKTEDRHESTCCTPIALHQKSQYDRQLRREQSSITETLQALSGKTVAFPGGIFSMRKS